MNHDKRDRSGRCRDLADRSRNQYTDVSYRLEHDVKIDKWNRESDENRNENDAFKKSWTYKNMTYSEQDAVRRDYESKESAIQNDIGTRVDFIVKGHDIKQIEDIKQTIGRTKEFKEYADREMRDFEKANDPRYDYKNKNRDNGSNSRYEDRPKRDIPDPHIARLSQFKVYFEKHCLPDSDIQTYVDLMLYYNEHFLFRDLKKMTFRGYPEKEPNSLIWSQRPLSNIIKKDFCDTTEDSRTKKKRFVRKSSICIPITECLTNLNDYYTQTELTMKLNRIKEWNVRTIASYVAISLIRISLASLDFYMWPEYAIACAKCKYLESSALGEAFASGDMVRIYLTLQIPMLIEVFWSHVVTLPLMEDGKVKGRKSNPELTHNKTFEDYNRNTKDIFFAACWNVSIILGQEYDSDDVNFIYNRFFQNVSGPLTTHFRWYFCGDKRVSELMSVLELPGSCSNIGDFIFDSRWANAVSNRLEYLNGGTRKTRCVLASSFYNIFFNNGVALPSLCKVTGLSREYFEARMVLCKYSYIVFEHIHDQDKDEAFDTIYSEYELAKKKYDYGCPTNIGGLGSNIEFGMDKSYDITVFGGEGLPEDEAFGNTGLKFDVYDEETRLLEQKKNALLEKQRLENEKFKESLKVTNYSDSNGLTRKFVDPAFFANKYIEFGNESKKQFYENKNKNIELTNSDYNNNLTAGHLEYKCKDHKDQKYKKPGTFSAKDLILDNSFNWVEDDIPETAVEKRDRIVRENMRRSSINPDISQKLYKK